MFLFTSVNISHTHPNACTTQVDGLHNPKVQVVYLQDCPIQKASWAAGGAQVRVQWMRLECACAVAPDLFV